MTGIGKTGACLNFLKDGEPIGQFQSWAVPRVGERVRLTHHHCHEGDNYEVTETRAWYEVLSVEYSVNPFGHPHVELEVKYLRSVKVQDLKIEETRND